MNVPYLINVFSSRSISHLLRIHSINYFHERGGGLVEKGLRRERDY